MLHSVVVYKTGQELCTSSVEELAEKKYLRPRKSSVRGKLREEYEAWKKPHIKLNAIYSFLITTQFNEGIWQGGGPGWNKDALLTKEASGDYVAKETVTAFPNLPAVSFLLNGNRKIKPSKLNIKIIPSDSREHDQVLTRETI